MEQNTIIGEIENATKPGLFTFTGMKWADLEQYMGSLTYTDNDGLITAENNDGDSISFWGSF